MENLIPPRLEALFAGTRKEKTVLRRQDYSRSIGQIRSYWTTLETLSGRRATPLYLPVFGDKKGKPPTGCL